jgi:hypothetical protein
MNLYAPNIVLFVISGCLAFIGVMASLPIELPIPGIVLENSALYIFLGWFLLSVGTVLPPRDAAPAKPASPELPNRR